MARSKINVLTVVSTAAVVLTTLFDSSGGFSVPRVVERSLLLASPRRSTALFVSKVKNTPSDTSSLANERDNDESISDEELLNQTPESQLEDLCTQFELSTKGTKAELLGRLRGYAKEQGELERQRRMQRKERVDEGGESEKERHEIVGEDDEEDIDDEVFFYYHDPKIEAKQKEGKDGKSDDDEEGAPESTMEKMGKMVKSKSKTAPRNRQGAITAPPPPPVEPDENGERVVTVYSTSDQNDLTGIAASQPGQAAQSDPMLANMGGGESTEAWDQNNPQRAQASSAELEAAKEAVSDLVQSLLAMSGGPAFQQDADDLTFLGVVRGRSSYDSPEGFTGFDPSKVPSDMLTATSKALRASRGQVLKEVLNEWELRSVGYDGTVGDNMEKGGGHYREVTKVRSFLEGYRRAEVRRLSRETATMLLDKLVSEGIEGLDITLASMTRSTDDTSDVAGELNDSLLDYLNDIIRQQEKKVEQMINTGKKIDELERSVAIDPDQVDLTDQLWSVADEDGQRIETFDPNDPKTKRVLEEEYKRSQSDKTVPRPIIPKTAPEKLLLLLTLLRARVKTEAAFVLDEKSRNLRVLAYCLNVSSEDDREQLILKEFGASLDVSAHRKLTFVGYSRLLAYSPCILFYFYLPQRLDSFAELIASSIEYGESTSHQLQPTKSGPLNVNLLKNILELVEEIRERQSWKASGAKTNALKL
jgi:hypothetical protein